MASKTAIINELNFVGVVVIPLLPLKQELLQELFYRIRGRLEHFVMADVPGLKLQLFAAMFAISCVVIVAFFQAART